MFSSKLKILYGFIKSHFCKRQAKSPIIIKNKIKKKFFKVNFVNCIISYFFTVRFFSYFNIKVNIN